LSIKDDIALLAVRSRDRRTKAAYSAQQSINATLLCSRSGPAIGGTKAAYSAQQSINATLLCSRSGTESDVTPQH
jgi:hypothetical protein